MRARTVELAQSETRYRTLFENSPVSLWEEDFSKVKAYLESLRDEGVADFRAYFEEHPDAVVRCKGLVKIIDVNDASVKLHKAGSKKNLCDNQDKVFSGDILGFFTEEILAFWEGKTSYESEFVAQTLDGDTIYTFMRILFAPGCEDTWSKVYLSVMDITELKKTEKVLMEAKKEAELASKAKGSFLANMSHDLRTPMNGILGMTDILLESELDSFQRDCAETVSSSGKALLNLLNDILDFSKIESGKLEIAVEKFSMRNVIEDTFDIFASIISQKGIALNSLVSERIPRSFLGDSTRIQQILVNLLGNDTKFTNKGEILLKVGLLIDGQAGTNNLWNDHLSLPPEAIGNETDPAKCRLIFSIKDSGIGIPENRQKQIFEEFSQADVSTTRKYGGSGLGLAISRKLVELMGGRLLLKSKEGEGTTFYFTLSLKRLSQPEEETNGAEPTLNGRTVLIVDDNRTNQKVLQYYTDHWNMKSLIAENGSEAMNLLKENGTKIDFCLLDWAMPGMDGYELARRIHSLNLPEPPVQIIFSSIDQMLKPQEREKYGISAVLQKPLKYSALNKLLSDFSKKRAIDELVKSKSNGSENGSKNNGLKVLLVEDNTANQKVALYHLKKMGHDPDIAENGKTAVEIVGVGSYDVVFMDVQMPLMDGFEATRRIRAMEHLASQPKIIGLTALAMEGDRERCLDAGMDDYISKPFHKDELDRVLEFFKPVS